MKLNIIIQTHSRGHMVRPIVESFDRFNHHLVECVEFYISDNGNQNFNKDFIKRKNVTYINQSQFKSSRDHTFQIYRLNLINSFIIHDDDSFNLKYLIEAIDFICTSNCEVLISPKLRLKETLTFNHAKAVFKFYFLDPRNNCPLLSGLFVKNLSVMKQFTRENFLMQGKYADVQIVTDLLCGVDNTFVFNKPFIDYHEHESNDNKERNLQDREYLEQYILGFNGIYFRILSKLIYHGYSERQFIFIHGLILSALRPQILYRLIQKFIFKSLKK